MLFLIFNRPDCARASFESIRNAHPAKLFIASDGPRSGVSGESLLVDQTREIAKKVDWDCEVKVLFQIKNLGCRFGVSTAIDWFFSHVDEGIILEDDCVASPEFFRFCDELLYRFRGDERVTCITGNNFQRGIKRGRADYYFSIFNHCWGWATWRRAWQHYDNDMACWPNEVNADVLSGLVSPVGARYWSEIFDEVKAGHIDSWAYIWTLSCWANSGLTATPNKNLVRNIGFDERATHTKVDWQNHLQADAGGLAWPLAHPTRVLRCNAADRLVEKVHFGINKTTCAQKIKRFLAGRARSFLKVCSSAGNY